MPCDIHERIRQGTPNVFCDVLRHGRRFRGAKEFLVGRSMIQLKGFHWSRLKQPEYTGASSVGFKASLNALSPSGVKNSAATSLALQPLPRRDPYPRAISVLDRLSKRRVWPLLRERLCDSRADQGGHDGVTGRCWMDAVPAEIRRQAVVLILHRGVVAPAVDHRLSRRTR